MPVLHLMPLTGSVYSCLEAKPKCAVQRTGSTLPKHTFFGKPNSEPYRLAEAVLSEQSQQLGLLKGNTNAGKHTFTPPRLTNDLQACWSQCMCTDCCIGVCRVHLRSTQACFMHATALLRFNAPWHAWA